MKDQHYNSATTSTIMIMIYIIPNLRSTHEKSRGFIIAIVFPWGIYGYPLPSPSSQKTSDSSLNGHCSSPESPEPGPDQPASHMSLDTQTGRVESLRPQSLQVGHLSRSEEQLCLPKPVLTGVLGREIDIIMRLRWERVSNPEYPVIMPCYR